MGMHQYLTAGPEAAGGVRPVSKELYLASLLYAGFPEVIIVSIVLYFATPSDFCNPSRAYPPKSLTADPLDPRCIVLSMVLLMEEGPKPINIQWGL